jgi:hypothetical protein
MEQLVTAVDRANRNYGGNIRIHPDAYEGGFRKPVVTGRIDVHDSRGKGARTTWQGRRGPYACWHAYRDVLTELFDIVPDAKVTTTMAVYDGRRGFEREYPATADRNIGSAIDPGYMPDLCECER